MKKTITTNIFKCDLCGKEVSREDLLGSLSLIIPGLDWSGAVCAHAKTKKDVCIDCGYSFEKIINSWKTAQSEFIKLQYSQEEDEE